jgi:hypothetical protein
MPPMLTSWTQEGVELAVEPAMGVEVRSSSRVLGYLVILVFLLL